MFYMTYGQITGIKNNQLMICTTKNSYIIFNARTHHSAFDAVLEQDEEGDLDREADLAKPKLTFTECVVALVSALTLVTLLAVFLVENIEHVVESGVPDQFLGLILLPLVEKAAEHLTAVDEAWDGQMVCHIEYLILFPILNMHSSNYH